MTTPSVEELFDSLRAYVHLESVHVVLFALAVAVTASLEDGDPLWGMIVDPPSSLKTEIVRMLDGVAHERPDEITAPSLLSWSKAKEPKPVGILTRLPNPAFLTVADFSTVLATSDKGGREQLFALLRRAYDGQVSRDLGNSPRPLTWHGRLTILAACTPAIDNYSSHADALGPRWLNKRGAAHDAEGKRATGRKALARGKLDEHRARAARLAAQIVREARASVPDVLDEEMSEALLDCAIVACYGRAAVERSGYGARDIVGLAVVEEPPRLAGQLAMLARALLALGLEVGEALGLCRSCALDSIPQARRLALSALARGAATASEVARSAVCDRKVARFALEELGAIGVASCEEEPEPGAPNPWTLDAPTDELIRKVMLDHVKAAGLGRKVEPPPPTPLDGSVASYLSSQGPEPDLDPDGYVRDLSLDELDAMAPPETALESGNDETRAEALVLAHFPGAEVVAG